MDISHEARDEAIGSQLEILILCRSSALDDVVKIAKDFTPTVKRFCKL